MKARTAVIALVTAGAVTGGSIYAAYNYTQSHKEPVKVMPVSTANIGSWFFDDEEDGDSLEGTLFSRDTQTVNLLNEYALEKVYVEQGDTVKIGDPLIEYDMTLTELQLEMEEILMERLSMTLQKQETQLEKIKANPNAASVITSDDEDFDLDDDDDSDDSMDDTWTSSADLIQEERIWDDSLPNGLDSVEVIDQSSAVDLTDSTQSAFDVIETTDISDTDLISDSEGASSVDGLTDGLSDGLSDDLTDGLSDEISDDLTDGLSDGLADDLTDGLSDGLAGDLTNGLSDGITDELTDGVTDGLTDTDILEDMEQDDADDSIAVSETEGTDEDYDLITPETAVDTISEADGENSTQETAETAEEEASAGNAEEDLLQEDQDEDSEDSDEEPSFFEIEEDTESDLLDDGQENDSTYVLDGDVLNVSTDDEMTLFDITEFRAIENRLRQQEKEDSAQLDESDIESALQLFRNSLSDTPAKGKGTVVTINPDVFGNVREVEIYVLNDAVDQVLNSAFGDKDKVSNHKARLYRAYMNVLYYDLLVKMQTLTRSMEEGGVNASTITALQAQQLKEQIAAAVSAYYTFICEWDVVKGILTKQLGYTDEDAELVYSTYYQKMMVELTGVSEDLYDPLDGILSKLAEKLNYEEVIETEPQETEEPLTEDFDDGGDDYDDFDDDGGDDSGLTQDEIREMIRDQEAAIAETKLQIREKAIKIRQYERTIAGKVVTATVNGVVKSAGTVDGSGTDDGFVVVSGAKGMYVTISVNELKLADIQVGDIVTGTSYETDEEFTGVITEISEYPSDNDDSYSWYWYFSSDSDNPNASFYPVTAYIEDADDLAEGSATVTIQSTGSESETGGKLYLENYFVRTDSTGQAYVYIQGDDGLLKKQYVRTGGSLWGTGVEIKAGISNSDFIAFPYGKNVVEGAEVVQVETVEEY